ncbi:MAG: Hpt domain-containing protein [Vampirovibrionales bacterium]|nr:Hpt domain-containing protein [Vampirovibrionales bacterium]
MTVLSENPTLDLRSLLLQLDGDLDAARALLTMFLEDARLILAELRVLGDSAEERRHFEIKIHGLKGACANIGAERMRARCLALEMLARSQAQGGLGAMEDAASALEAGLSEVESSFAAVCGMANAWLKPVY